LRIDFHLYGTVGSDDKTEFDEAMQENKHRFRDQVIMTIRGCEHSELTDAGLGLIKRKILEKTNRTLGKPLLQAVIFTDFSFIEQELPVLAPRC
jgi:flagellar basal body-associated protein FliL